MAHEVVRAQILERVREAGHLEVTPANFPLWRFEGLDGRRPGDIATTAGLSKQAVTGQLRGLERQGYLERVAHPEDGRARLVRLTASGRALEQAVREAARAVDDTWRREIGDHEWALFRAVLDQIAELPPPGR